MISSVLRIALCLAVAASLSFARTKAKPVDKDNFEVVGHIALTGGSVSRVLVTSHYSLNYLYAEHASGGTVMVIDTTNVNAPRVLSSISGSGSLLGSLLIAAGDAALFSSEPPAPASAGKTISIFDFSDKANPKVTREFPGVTAMTTDDRRGLVFLTNAEGLWILHRNLPLDPEVQERYAHQVLYQ